MRYLKPTQWATLGVLAVGAAFLIENGQDWGEAPEFIGAAITLAVQLMVGTAVIWLTSQWTKRGPSPFFYCLVFLIGISVALYLQPLVFPGVAAR